jgi:hypothetical protein
MSVLPKFKTIKIKIDNNHNLDINNKGILTISSCKKEKKDIDINKLNSAICKIKNNFTEGKKRGRKAKIINPIINELIETTETEQEMPIEQEPLRVHKKRGPKPKIKEDIVIIKRKRGRPRKIPLEV